jgi:hypothetical protein
MNAGQSDSAGCQRLPSFRSVFLASVVVVGVIVVVWLWADLSLDQVGFLGMGGSGLFAAWLVWQYQILGFSYRKGFGTEPETEEPRRHFLENC